MSLKPETITSEDKLEIVKKSLASYQDFPKPGIYFRDVFSILKNVEAFKCLMDLLIDHVDSLFLKTKIDLVIGLDSRGFLFGPLISLHVRVPFVPVRKRGKLPGKTVSQDFILEYGEAAFEIQADSVKNGQRALIIDDLLATGGSMGATCKLLEKLGVNIVECLVIMELCDLKGRDAIKAPVYSFLKY